VRWLKQAVQALLDHHRITIDPHPTDDT
jgi:hypothetical protein